MKFLVKKNRWILTGVMLLGALNAVAAAFISVILQQILDVAIAKDSSGFARLAVVMIIYMAVLCGLSLMEAFCSKILLRNITKDLRNRIFYGIMGRDPQSYYKQTSADYLSAVLNDVKLIEENYLMPLLLTCQMVVLFFATLAVLCYFSPLITGILIAFLLLMFLVPTVFGKALQKRQERYSHKLATFTAAAKDFFGGYEVIWGFSIGGRICRKFSRENEETANVKFQADRLAAVNESLAELLSTLSSAATVFIAAYMVLKGDITAGTLLALIQLSSTFSVPVLMIMQNLPKMQSMKPVLEKLEAFCEGAHTEEAVPQMAEPFDWEIRLDHVRFAYEPGTYILKDVGLTVQPGKKYALLGESGSGKTTLIRLMTGYLTDYEGSIRFGDCQVRDMSNLALSRLVSVIHQNVYLFDTDIEQNICLGQTFSKKEMNRALKKSGTNKFLQELDGGLHFKTGENGSRLSGGQRQRIALARALIRKTPVLILDEGTSAVDRSTAHAIEEELLQEPQLTLITITHHMQDDLRAFYNEIFYMEDGKITKKGIDIFCEKA